ncbi:MAG TPA: AbrB/MazE/SpoVT family DNA-binding domain-containing protein [Candidatus Bathyarchaeia archaeon]|nr:AbrB/MazE/SpoVT family DNA-binding domain-containing protein [Candidatus Bathyarchaeia archaeon]
MSNVRVKRKGQVTIPVDLRQRLKIEEGSVLEVREHEEGILLKPAGPLEGGEVVGKESYEKILRELDSTRKKWR